MKSTPCEGDYWLGSRWALETDTSAAIDVLGGNPFASAPASHGRQVATFFGIHAPNVDDCHDAEDEGGPPVCKDTLQFSGTLRVSTQPRTP